MLNFTNQLTFGPFPEFNIRLSLFDFDFFLFDLANLRSGSSCVNPTETKNCELQLELRNVGKALNPIPFIQNIPKCRQQIRD